MSIDKIGPQDEIKDVVPKQDHLPAFFDAKTVVVADNQASAKWFIIAIVIGSLVVLGGGSFGIVGLLYSHHLISLPQWLALAIGTVGNTPHYWSLWTLAIGSLVVEGIFIGIGVAGLKQIRKSSFKVNGDFSSDIRADPNPQDIDRQSIGEEKSGIHANHSKQISTALNDKPVESSYHTSVSQDNSAPQLKNGDTIQGENRPPIEAKNVINISEEEIELSLSEEKVSLPEKKVRLPQTLEIVPFEKSILKRAGRQILLNSDYHPDANILQFVLADFVGGGEGNQVKNTVEFLTHYLKGYCAVFPEDVKAYQLLVEFQCFFELSDESLEIVEGEMIAQLCANGYVFFSGGFSNIAAGHAILTELILKDNQVTLRMTNTGDGSEFHPVYSSKTQNILERDKYYRTLIFTGVSLDELRRSQFLKRLISYKRAYRKQDPAIAHFLSVNTQYLASQTCSHLIQAWPGNSVVLADNPGGGQRANSCSVFAPMKKIRGNYHADIEDYIYLNFWIKVNALHDFLHHQKEISSQFIADAVYKISTLASKMKHHEMLDEGTFLAWEEVFNLATKCLKEAKTAEEERLLEAAFKLPENVDWTEALPRSVSDSWKKRSPGSKSSKVFKYAHCFLGERANYDQAAALADPLIASPYDEMAYRLNFVRSLPDFNQFDDSQFSSDADKIGMEKRFKKSFYQLLKRGRNVINDDLFLSSFFEHPQIQNLIEKTDKMSASKKKYVMRSLISIFRDKYNSCYLDPSFATTVIDALYQDPKVITEAVIDALYQKPEVIERLKSTEGKPFYSTHRKVFFNSLLKVLQRFFYHESYASVHIPDSFIPDLFNGWMIAYREALREGKISLEVRLEWMRGLDLLIHAYSAEYIFDNKRSSERFGAIALFCKKEMASLLAKLGPTYVLPTNPWTIWDHPLKTSYWRPYGNDTHIGYGIQSWDELPAMARFGYDVTVANPDYRFFHKQKDKDYLKAINLFPHPLKEIPYYDLLRRSLAYFFSLADRHIEMKQYGSSKKRKLPTALEPRKDEYLYQTYLTLSSKYEEYSKRPGVSIEAHFHPETQLGALNEKYQAISDPNVRTSTALQREERTLPFFSETEEFETLNSVIRHWTTSLTESLKFFEGKWSKLVHVDYQTALEWMIFRNEGGKLLEHVFENPDAPLSQSVRDLLFNFIEEGYENILNTRRIEAVAGFLFHLHLRLCQLAFENQTEDASRRVDALFHIWERVLERGKKNGILAKALSEGVFAALPAVACSKKLREDPRMLSALAATLLLECSLEEVLSTKYDQLTLTYGYHVFKEMLARAQPEEIWSQAVKTIFDKPEPIMWDQAHDTLRVGHQKYYLISRTIEGGTGKKMRILPKKMTEHTDYQTLFGKKQLRGTPFREGEREGYWVTWKNKKYIFGHDSKTNTVEIWKMFDEEAYQFSATCDSLGSLFKKGYIFWMGKEHILVEKQATQEIEALIDDQGVHAIQLTQISSEILGSLQTSHPFYSVFAAIESPGNTYVWIDSKTHEIRRIELPRLGLRFKRKTIGTHSTLISEDYPGFSIAHIQYAPFLKNFKSYLVLENAKGQKKVIVPVRSLVLGQYLPYQQKPLITQNEGETEEKRIVIYDVEKGEMHPKPLTGPDKISASLMLVYLYLATHQYTEALQLLKRSFITKQKTIKPHEWKILEFILNIQKSNEKLDDLIDFHPHAIAVRLRLFSWAMELQQREKGSIDSTLKERFYNDFKKYTDLHHSLGNFKISTNKLTKLTTFFPKIPRLQSPLHEKLELATNRLFPVDAFWELREAIYARLKESPLPLSSLTAPGEEFALNFLPYYAIAKKGKDVEKSQLRAIIASCSYDSSLLIACPSLIFAWALEKDKAPSFEEIASYFQLNKENFSEKFYALSRQAQIFGSRSSESMRGWLTGKQEKITIKPIEQAKPIFTPLPPIADRDFEELKIANIPDYETLDPALIDKPIVTSATQNGDKELAATHTFIEWTNHKAHVAQKEGNFLLEHEFLRLHEGAVQHLKELQVADKDAFSLSRDLVSVQSILKNYKQVIRNKKDHLSDLEEDILSAANNIHQDRRVKLEQMRGLRPQFDIQILMIAFGRRDLSAIKNINPTLSQAEIDTILTKVAEYIEKRCEMQKLVRCKSKLKEYVELLEAKEDEATLNAASDEYFVEQQASRAYIPSDHPKLFAFEALTNIIMREDQVKALQTLTGEETWTLFEARTGFGKSKVVLPLWLLLTAQPDQLACMIVPATLFDQQQLYLQQVLCKAYHVFAMRLDFTRDSECSVQDISALIHKLKKAQRMRKPVFMSDQTAANLFVLKIKELFTQAVDQKSSEVVGLLLELRRYMKENGVVFIDEPHKVLDDSQESNYSIGKLHLFNEDRLLFGLQIYSCFFKVIEKRYHVECWQTADTRHLPELTEDLFRKDILAKLVDLLIKEGMIQTDQTGVAYLLGKMAPDEQADYEKYLAHHPDSVQAMKIKVLHDQLHHYLPQTLGQNVNEHYACQDASVRTGIPLECARNPKKGNEFCSADQIINFTIQANLASPFSRSYVETYFEGLVDQTLEELDANKPIDEIAAYQKFILITQRMGAQAPKSLLKMDFDDFKRIRHHIAHDVEACLHFIGCAVLPQLTRYEKKATCTPHLLVHCFKKAVGAAGTLTLENLPSKFTIKADEKAIARTLITLIKKYADAGSPPVVELAVKKAQDIVAKLPTVAECSELDTPSVLLEIGALMREYSSLVDFAKDLLAAFSPTAKFDGIATFDEQGLPIIFEAESDRFISLSVSTAKNVFWVYLQKDTTGTDNKLPPLAQALAGVNKYTNLNELVQGIGRMRGIHAAQDARFFLGEDSFEIRKILKKEAGPLSHLDIIEYCAIKQAEMKGKVNVHSLPIKWDALFENIFWDYAISWRKHPFKVAEDFDLLEKVLLLEETPDSPLTRPSLTQIEIPAEIALPQMKLKQIAKLETIHASLKKSKTQLAHHYQLELLSKKMDEESKGMHFASSIALNEATFGTQHTIASSTTVAQAESQAAQNRVLDIHGTRKGEQMAENVSESTNLWTTWTQRIGKRPPLPYLDKLEAYSIEEVFSHPTLQHYIPLFASKGFSLAINGFVTFQGDSLSHPGWINGYVKNLHYLWLQHHPNGVLETCILLDEGEAARKILEADLPTEQPGTLWLVNQGIVFSQQGKSRSELYEDENFVSLELRSKILNGDFTLNPRQKEVLTKWITTETSDLFIRFIKTILFPIRPSLVNSSDFQKLSSALTAD